VSIEDWSGYPAAVRERYLRTTAWTPVISMARISGFQRRRIRRPAAIPALKLGEDVALVSSLLARKGDVRFAGPAHVATSARWESTIEGGFAFMCAACATSAWRGPRPRRSPHRLRADTTEAKTPRVFAAFGYSRRASARRHAKINSQNRNGRSP